ncbi:hypothetical protein BH20VER2_BH20VER2_03710 [soil metagenome]
MKHLCRNRRFTALLLALLTGSFALVGSAQPPPPGEETPSASQIPAAEVVDYSKLLPILPEPPEGWKADQAEGSTDNIGETSITNVHRDYQKGEGGDGAPTTAISILDSASNPEYVESTTAAWDANSSDPEGYTKSVTIEGLPGFETFENEGKHGTLWLMVAKRYFLQIETSGQDASALQEWIKRIDLKKLTEVK